MANVFQRERWNKIRTFWERKWCPQNKVRSPFSDPFYNCNAVKLKDVLAVLHLIQCKVSGVNKMRREGLGTRMNKSVASHFLHKLHSQVSKQRIQGLFIVFRSASVEDFFFFRHPFFHALVASKNDSSSAQEQQDRYFLVSFRCVHILLKQNTLYSILITAFLAPS